MKKFLLFIAGLIAAMILIANVGPLVLLGASIWLLYIVFKQFMKAESTTAKIGWIVLGLVILSVGISNIYAIIGIVAAFVLYLVVKHWKTVPDTTFSSNTANDTMNHQDPFMNFEQQWGEINK